MRIKIERILKSIGEATALAGIFIALLVGIHWLVRQPEDVAVTIACAAAFCILVAMLYLLDAITKPEVVE